MQYRVKPIPFWEEPKKKREVKPSERRKLLTKPKKCQWCRKLKAQHVHHLTKTKVIALCAYCHQRYHSGEITKAQMTRRFKVKKSRKRTRKKSRRRTMPLFEPPFKLKLVKFEI